MKSDDEPQMKEDRGSRGAGRPWTATPLRRQRTEAERDTLRRLASSPGPVAPDPVLHQLLREGYVQKQDGQVAIAVPLFRDWIAQTQGGA